MADDTLVTGERTTAGDLYRRIATVIREISPGLPPRLAFFGCSDEANSGTDNERFAVFGQGGGIFTTRMIGSQVFYHQLKVAISEGHCSNVFEVNVHIGEVEREGVTLYGSLVGRDGMTRACCGTLVNVLDDFINNPDEVPSVSALVDGELYLDFMGTLKFRLQPVSQSLIAAANPLLEVTRKNLEIQVTELVRRLEQFAAETPSLAPLFVFGTIAYNHQDRPDTLALEHFLVLRPLTKGQIPKFESRL